MNINRSFKNALLTCSLLFKSKCAFTLMEILVVVVIFLFMMAGIIGVFFVGQRTWQNTETSIEIQQDIRKVTSRIFKELRQSGYSDLPGSAEWKYWITTGASADDPDILRFQVPVDPDGDGKVVHLDGETYYIDWGAMEKWADRSSTANHQLGYFIEYSVDNGQLVRKFLNDSFQEQSRAIFANNIFNFKVNDTPANPTADDDVIIDVTITTQSTTLWGRVMTSELTSQVILRNREH